MAGHGKRIKEAIAEVDAERDTEETTEEKSETSTDNLTEETPKAEEKATESTEETSTETTEEASETTTETPTEEPKTEDETTETPKDETPKAEKETTKKASEKKKEEKPEETQQPTLWWNTEEEKSTETTPKTETEKVVTDELLNDPEVKAFIEAKKNGKTLASFLNEIKGVDVDKISAEDIFKVDLQKYGAKDEALEDALEEFRAKPAWQRDKDVAPLREAMKKEQAEKLSKFSTDSALESQKQDDLLKKGYDDLDTHLKDITGTKIDGFEITKEVSDGIGNFVKNQFNIYKEDGSFNIPYLVDIALYKTHKKEIMKANFESLEKQIEDKYIKEYSRPSKKETSTTSPDVASQAEKDQQGAETYARRFNPVYNNH